MATLASAELLKIFVLHRHGARTPQGLIDGGADVSCSYPNCQLTNVGKAQCMAVGRYIKATYAAQLNMSDGYTVKHMSSYSTEVSRVVISGESMILGMYPGSLPYVDFIPLDVDLAMSYWTSWPAWKIRATYIHDLHKNDDFIRATIGETNLTRMGKQFNMETVCQTQPANCIMYVNDALSANLTNGWTTYPWLVAIRPKMKKVVARLFATYLGYKPTANAYDRAIGSYGFPLATEAMQLLGQPLDTSNPWGFDYRIIHRAAHDWTVFPFYASLGAWTDNTADVDDPRFVIQFAETVILEAHQAAPGAPVKIKASYGIPDQAHLDNLDNYRFHAQPLGVKCRHVDGSTTLTTDHPDGCDLNDVWRFINTTRPQSSEGVCYADKAYLAEFGCLDDAAPAVGSRCHFYRHRCPDAPCGSSFGSGLGTEKLLADPAKGYACQSLQRTKRSELEAGTIVLLTLPGLAVGAVIGFLASRRWTALFRRWCMERTSSEMAEGGDDSNKPFMRAEKSEDN